MKRSYDKEKTPDFHHNEHLILRLLGPKGCLLRDKTAGLFSLNDRQLYTVWIYFGISPRLGFKCS